MRLRYNLVPLRGLSLCTALGLLIGCSSSGLQSDEAGPSSHAPANPSVAALPAPVTAAAPLELPNVASLDRDRNQIEDALEASTDADEVLVNVVLTQPVLQRHLDAFVAQGGRVKHVFEAVSYGFIGSISRAKLRALRTDLGSELLLVGAPKKAVPYLDEATRTGRVRGVWATNFAGFSAGLSGNANITIGVLDTGVDGTHTDLKDNSAGNSDYTADGSKIAEDVQGHGTHVTSIAVGTGKAFGLGPGTLHWTDSGSLAAVPANQLQPAPIHTPLYLGGASTMTVSSSATWLGGGTTALVGIESSDPAGGWSAFASSASAGSPLSIASTSISELARYAGTLVQSNPALVGNYAVANTLMNYPAVGDGFNALRGVAPSCKWYDAKVFSDAGLGDSSTIEAALDDLVKRRATLNVKVLNMSLGSVGADPVLRSMVNNAVDSGIIAVVAAGNSGPGGTISDPGLAGKAITVAAANDQNELTTYSSIGFTPNDTGEDSKPDLVAPGGSSYRSAILAVDSNTADAESSTFGDVVANDYTSLQGTSMASPFVAGAAALMIDAIQQSGVTWTLASNTQPLLVKMLLLASATETNVNREQGAGSNPSLGRAATPKDFFEGYGILNPDAAIESYSQTLPSVWTGSVSNTAPARLEWERRAWGRNVSLINGATVSLNLTVPSTADLDLYLYAGTPDSNGNPLIRASSTHAGVDTDEAISYTSLTTETAYVLVKRVSGYGSFSLTGSASNKCGNGVVDTGEQCDPGASGSACCTASCQNVSNGTACSDGNACTKTDSCQAGVCVGSSPVTCATPDQCHNAGMCDTSTGLCSNPAKTDGTACNDNNACTKTDLCEAGKCTGSNPVTCATPDQCHDAGMCDTSTGLCSNPAKTDGTACNDSNACTKTDLCEAGKCTGSNPVTCATPDQCHNAGMCDTSTGLCSNPAKTDGTACNDNNACTKIDSCQAGACVGSSLVTCPTPDQCHSAGACDISSGICSNPAKTDGTACNDDDACTKTDLCEAGTCKGTNPVVCVSGGDCLLAGACSSSTGVCSAPVAPDGTACSKGSCSSGMCMSVGGGGSGGVGGTGGTSANGGAGVGGNAGTSTSGGGGGSGSAGSGTGGTSAGTGGNAGSTIGGNSGSSGSAGNNSGGSAQAGATDGADQAGATGESAGTGGGVSTEAGTSGGSDSNAGSPSGGSDPINGGSTGLTSQPSGSKDSGGCGCNVVGRTTRSFDLIALVGLVGVLGVRRKRALRGVAPAQR